MWIILIVVLATAVIAPIIWSVFVHPLRSAATVLKLALGLGGIAYLLSGIVLENFASGAIGVALLIAASAVSALQTRRI